MNNLDEDIKILKELAEDTIKYNMVETDAYMAGAIIRVLKELETYKKIAEKLAEEVHYLSEDLQLTNENLTFKYCDLFAEENKCENECSKCIIDWARKEVEKDGI